MTNQDLKMLTDRQLHERIKELVAQKRTSDLLLIEALVFMRNNQAFQRAGYYSLAQYLRDALGFSSDESWKTSQAVHVIWRFPKIGELLASGQTHLSHVALLRPRLTNKNADRILEFLPGKSRRELEGFLSTIDQHGRSIAAEPKVRLVVECSPKLVEKVDYLRQLRSQAGHQGELAKVLEEAVDQMIAKIDPAKKAERAEARAVKRASQEVSPKGGDNGNRGDCTGAVASTDGAVDTVQRGEPSATSKVGSEPCPGAGRPKRLTIPASIRYRIYLKYQSRCCFESPDGRRCTKRAGLQIDHILPVSRGGINHPDNLRLLCPVHNRIAAVRVFGIEFMRRKQEGASA